MNKFSVQFLGDERDMQKQPLVVVRELVTVANVHVQALRIINSTMQYLMESNEQM